MKKILISIFLVILVSNFVYSTSSTDVSGTSNINDVTSSCMETDDGINYQLKGTTSKDGVFTDLCVDANILKEYYCAGTRVVYQMYRCSYGCKDGGCLRVPLQKSSPTITTQVQQQTYQRQANYTCKDTDNGINVHISGIASIYNGQGQIIYSGSDFCASDQVLYEKYCKYFPNQTGWKVEQLNYRCANGCTNGRCLATTQEANVGSVPKQSPSRFGAFGWITRIFGFGYTGEAVRDTSKGSTTSTIFLLLGTIILIFALVRHSENSSSKQKTFKQRKKR